MQMDLSPNNSGNNNGPGPNNLITIVRSNKTVQLLGQNIVSLCNNGSGPGQNNSITSNNSISPGQSNSSSSGSFQSNLIASNKSSLQSSVMSSNKVQKIMTSGDNQAPSCQMSPPPPYPVSTCQNTSSDTNAKSVTPEISSHSRFSDHIPKDTSTSDSTFDKDMPIVDMIQMYLDNMP